MSKIFISEYSETPQSLDLSKFDVTKNIADADLIFPPREHHADKLEAIAIANGKYCPPSSPLKKSIIYETFKALGEEEIPTVLVNSVSDIEQFPYDKVFLKPNVFAGGLVANSIEYGNLYATITKDQAIAYFPNHKTGDGLVIQPSLVKEDGSIDGFICSGAVNGSGQIHFNRMVNPTNHVDLGIIRTVRKSMSPEIESEARRLASKYIEHHNIRNTVFACQFIRVNNKLLVNDFQYRFAYFEVRVIPVRWPEYLSDRYKFAFDIIQEVPEDKTRIMQAELIDIPEDKDASFVKKLMEEMSVAMMHLRERTGLFERKRLFVFFGDTQEQVNQNIFLFKERLCS